MGTGSGLETLRGISFGVGQLNMLEIYLQRSWVILNTTALMLMFLYIFATPILNFIRQMDDISEDAWTFALWMIPQLFSLHHELYTHKNSTGTKQVYGDGSDINSGVSFACFFQLAFDIETSITNSLQTHYFRHIKKSSLTILLFEMLF